LDVVTSVTPSALYEKSKSLGSGGSMVAWLFLVGGVICLVNSVNERDLDLLNSFMSPWSGGKLLRGTLCV